MSGCDCGCVDLRNSQFEGKECQLYYSRDRMLCIPFYTSLLVRLVGAVLSVIYSLILGFSVMSSLSSEY